MKEINKANELSPHEKGIDSKREIPTEENKRKLKDTPSKGNHDKPQPDWAKQAGYKERPGMKQVFVPSSNEHGALADGRFKVNKK